LKKYFLLIILVLSVQINAQVVINEVMFAPTAPNKEWFEIYNAGSSPVNIQNWKWRDAAQSNPVRTITAQNVLLNANSYAVICEDSANFRSAFAGVTGIVLQSVGWNALNNTGNENVVLYNSAFQISDSLTYSNTWGGTGGVSLERINPGGPTNSRTNWGSSIDFLKATPVRVNSLTPKQNELILKTFTITPAAPQSGDTLKFQIIVKNIGLNPASNYDINLYRDNSFDSIPLYGNLINSRTYTSVLNVNDSVIYNFNIPNIDSGRKQYIGLVVYAPDADTLNNKLVRTVTIGGPVVTTGLIINEIMYAPQSPEPEWIEIYNNSGTAVNIKNWKLSDSTSQSNPGIITSSDKIINPNDYIVIAKSNAIIPVHPLLDTTKIIYMSSLPTFNNDKDKVILFNTGGGIVDEVSYKSNWGWSPRNSLERKSFLNPSNDSSNWASSVDCEYSTPSRVNSVVNLTGALRNDVVVNEIMFDPISGSAEYVELYNISGKYLNFTGWRLYVSTSYCNIFDTCNLIIKPGMYVILSADTTIYNRFGYLKGSDSTRKVIFNSSLSLSNEGAVVRVLDVLNNVIDSLNYSPGWHNNNLADTKGYSLEKINPNLGSTDTKNWSSSASPLGGTPGQINSIFTQNKNANTGLSVSPNPFSPDGDGYEEFTIIKYKLKSNIASVRIKIYDVKGRLVRTLINNQISGNEAQIIFDGKNDNGEKLRIGIYIVYLEAVDDQGGTRESAKITIVIATKL
jgi:hypothetical protein